MAWGWELLVVAAGFGLIAYSSVDREPGPAYLGVLNLAAFAIITSFGVTRAGATLLGWPVALALAAAGAAGRRAAPDDAGARRRPTPARPSRRRCRCGSGIGHVRVLRTAPDIESDAI